MVLVVIPLEELSATDLIVTGFGLGSLTFLGIFVTGRRVGSAYPVGKPWDRQPFSGKVRRKMVSVPGLATRYNSVGNSPSVKGGCLAKESYGCGRRQRRRELRGAHCRQGTRRCRPGGRGGGCSARQGARFAPIRSGAGLLCQYHGRQRLRADGEFRYRHHHRSEERRVGDEPRRPAAGQF